MSALRWSAALVLVAAVVACSSDRPATGGGLGPTGTDAGSPASDAGSPGTDAGAPGTDAGAPGTDAGAPGADAGTPGTDAGTPGTDAGSPGTDAGTPPQQFRLNVVPQGSGSGAITSSPAGIDCGTTCTQLFPAGAQIALSATAAAGSSFAGYGGACSGVGPCVVTMNADATVWADFEASGGGGGGGGGGSDGGTTDGGADDCSMLAAPADPGPAPFNHFIPVHTSTGSDGPWFGVTTGTGTLALSMISSNFEQTDFVTRTGALLRSANSESTDFIGELSYFLAVAAPSQQSFVERWTDQGVLQTVAQTNGGLAEDPTGGGVGVDRFHDESGKTVVSYAGDLSLRWRVALPATVLALGVDRTGATLAILAGQQWYGKDGTAALWLDQAGRAGPIFQIPAPSFAPFAITQRVGSGLFIGDDDLAPRWFAQVDSFATATSNAPAWLTARGAVFLHMVRGGRGYAVIPPPYQTQDCVQDVEVVSSAGESCSVTRFRGAQGQCRTGPLSVGYDGTVMQAAPDPDPAHQEWFGPGTAYWQWWPQFFQ